MSRRDAGPAITEKKNRAARHAAARRRGAFRDSRIAA